MKIYIVGSVASGKSTFAKRLSEALKIQYKSLDEVMYILDKTNPWGNRKRQVEERNIIFHSIIQQQDWIVEDVGRLCFEEGLVQSDIIILLEISTNIRNYRIIKRWIKQRLGIEKCIYKPCYHMLRSMLQWSKDYDAGKDNLKDRISPYQEKVITLRSTRDINAFLVRSINSTEFA